MQRQIAKRKLDELNRLVLPKEVNASLNLKEKTVFNIYLDDDAGSIILIPDHENAGCILCGDTGSELLELGKQEICINCAKKINHLMEQTATK